MNTDFCMFNSKGVIFLACVAVVATGCSKNVIPLVPDQKWHVVYSLQVPSRSVELEVEAINACRAQCDPDRTPKRTQIRIVQMESFQDLDSLPERIEDAKPREDGIPIKLADSGSYDLTLLGSRRLVPLITGKQLLVRTIDECTALKVTDQTLKKQSDED